MQRAGFLPLVFVCLSFGISGCDITINSGTSDTDAGGEETGADTDASTGDADPPGEEPDRPGSSTSGGSTGGETTGGDDPTGDDPTGDDPTGDDPTGDDPTGDDPTGDDPTGDDPLACGDQACEACLECSVGPGESCDAVSQACGNNPDCVAMAECYAECAALPEQAAFEACWFDECIAGWPDAEVPFSEYINCLRDVCETPCT